MHVTHLLIHACLALTVASAATRRTESFDRDWRFARYGLQADGTRKPEPNNEIKLTDAQGKTIGDAAALPLAQPALDDTAWRKLDVPHDWGIEGPFRVDLSGNTGKLPWQGIGWYRKHFTVPATDAGKRVFVDFDGAMANAKVYCNGRFAGTWPYGYNSFRVDLTDFLKFGGDNVLAVRLDTEKWSNRWYPGAGIYRHVRLVTTEPVHVAHWGTFVTTPEVTDSKARVNIAIEIDNQGDTVAKTTALTDIYELKADDTTGAKVATFELLAKPFDIAPKHSVTINPFGFIANPKRWDLETPNRYLARTVILVDGKEVDSYDTPFGIRTLQFTARDGFLLNGKRVPIKGTCNHGDLGALGVAVNTRGLQRQIEILKSFGCNSLRTSHNPPAPEQLDLADKMGMLVWDEAFDCWSVGKHPHDYGDLFNEWHEKDLRALTHRDRNHPSVIIWSIGNEVMQQRDVALTKRLVDLVRAEDPTRPVSNGYNDPNGGRASGAAAALDIMGVNYFFGEQDKWDKDPRYQKMPTLGSETSSCVSSRGEYFQNTPFQVQSFDNKWPGWGCSPDSQFKILDRWPHLLGEYVWTGFDYLGEPTPYNSDATNLLNFRTDPSKRAELEKELARLAQTKPTSRSSYFGICDLAGFPKDRFYNYQAQWRPELPMAHLIPQNWNWPERLDKDTPVHVYTSGTEAELFLNGKSLGRLTKKANQDYRLVWNVKYQPGELKVVAYKDGKPWATDVVKTTGAMAALAATPDRAAIKADGQDLSFITVRVADSNGLTVPDAGPLVKFSIAGPGEIVAVDNGDATSFEPFQASQHKAYNGLALVIVRAKTGQPGSFTVTAAADGLKPATTRITTSE